MKLIHNLQKVLQKIPQNCFRIFSAGLFPIFTNFTQHLPTTSLKFSKRSHEMLSKTLPKNLPPQM